MNFLTQIGGKHPRSNESSFQLKKKLEHIGITVGYPSTQENTAEAYRSAVFSMYDLALDYYESIAESDIHLIDNVFKGLGDSIDEATAREILFAMTKQKPIILLHPPKFKASLGLFARETIERHVSKMYVCDLLELSDDELCDFLTGIAASKVDYSLTQRESVLIAADLRAYFRELAAQAKPKFA